MSAKNLEQLFRSDLQYLYNMEKQSIRVIAKMVKAANSLKLEDALNNHLAQSNKQLERIENIFKDLGTSPKGRTSKGISGIIEEIEDITDKKNKLDPYVLDASLIAAAQRMKHYEIAAYGTLKTYAKELKNYNAEALLDETLREEKKIDLRLSRIAKSSVNLKALN